MRILIGLLCILLIWGGSSSSTESEDPSTKTSGNSTNGTTTPSDKPVSTNSTVESTEHSSTGSANGSSTTGSSQISTTIEQGETTEATTVTPGPPTLPNVNVQRSDFKLFNCTAELCTYQFDAPQNSQSFLKTENAVIGTDNTKYSELQTEANENDKNITDAYNDATSKILDLQSKLGKIQQALSGIQSQMLLIQQVQRDTLANLIPVKKFVSDLTNAQTCLYQKCLIPTTPTPSPTTSPSPCIDFTCPISGSSCELDQSNKPYCTNCVGNLDGYNHCNTVVCDKYGTAINNVSESFFIYSYGYNAQYKNYSGLPANTNCKWLLTSENGFTSHYVSSYETSNRLVGKPYVSCRPEGVSLVARVAEPFRGQIFVKGAHSNPKCAKKFNNSTTQVELTIDADSLSSCGFQFWKKPGETAVLTSGQFVVSFHSELVTTSDQAFAAHCTFENHADVSNMLINQKSLVSDAKTVFGEFETPKIRMDILPAGELIILSDDITNHQKSVFRVGDPVLFKWSMVNRSDLFGINIESCEVTTKYRSPVQIISNGCSLDDELISDVSYSSDHSQVFANSLAFKFVDEDILNVRCAIRFCVKRLDHVRIAGFEEDVCAFESHCSIRNRRELEAKHQQNRISRDIVYVEGRLRIKQEAYSSSGLECREMCLRQTAASVASFENEREFAPKTTRPFEHSTMWYGSAKRVPPPPWPQPPPTR
ncbi:unnamed protein product [Caenorhabditis bovis]|uniref:ZP domain-containing protein n=1 Tax=Caenorhabditis bovis TaxID=2654633 RepID=A0A8S1ECC0_9PELO|nr:unnamed protein product [Caenorhabditis bovis]